MFPVLLTIGPLTIRTLTLVAIIAILAAAFAFWKKTREEHYEEAMVFDGWILAGVAGVIGARLGGLVLEVLSRGSLSEWWPAVTTVRYQALVGLLVGGVVLVRFAAEQKWDVWEILDYWTLGVSAGWALIWIGLFLDGTSVGLETSLPFGVRFPNVFSAVHPVQLYFAAGYLALYAYLAWAEYHYRTFNWYRAGKNTAQSGFLTAIFILVTGLLGLAMTVVRPAQIVVAGIQLDIPVYIATIIYGGWVLWRRSGHTFARRTATA